VLRVLSEVDQISLSEAAAVTMLLLPSISRIARDLEARELIERVSMGYRSNQTHMRMRPKGKKLVAKLLPRAEECLGTLAKQYGQQRFAELQAHLDAFAALKD
jgi:DNA-binding MarR family transcriptional regulator